MLDIIVSTLQIAAAGLFVVMWRTRKGASGKRFPAYARWKLALLLGFIGTISFGRSLFDILDHSESLTFRQGLFLVAFLGIILSSLSELRKVWSEAMRERVQVRRENGPSFFWQGILILLPVLFLTGIGIYSLRQDKETIRREALEQADRLAEELQKSLEKIVVSGGSSVPTNPHERFPEIEFRDVKIHLAPFSDTYIPRFPLTYDQKHLLERGTLNLPTLSVDSPLEDPVYKIATGAPNLQVAVFRGDTLLYPAPFVSSPAANDPFANLSTNQLNMLHAAHTALATNNSTLARKQIEALLETELPDGAARNLEFELAQVLLKSGASETAREQFTKVAEKAGLIETPGGIPLLPLARFKSAEILCASPDVLEKKRDAVVLAASAAVYFPSVLSDSILQQLETMERNVVKSQNLITREWRKVWEVHQTSRQLVANKPDNAAGWITNNVPWRFAHLPSSRLNVFKAQALPNLKARVEELLATTGEHPAYFNFGVLVGGHSFGNVETNQLIGSSTKTVTHGGEQVGPTIQVTVAVIRPDLLFSHHRKRQLWAGALIGAAALSSVIGFGAAFFSFRRQLRLNEMKSNFVSSVSHELRAPIASVRLMAEGLERDRITEPQKQKEYFRFIGQECRRLSSLIENVLDFSRIEQGRKQYEFEPTDLVKLVGETVKLMEPYAAEKNVKLCCVVAELSNGYAQPIIDGRAVQQALINLLDNAVKHSPAGETVTLQVDAGKVVSASRQPHITLSVEDHGPGIPAHEQEKIFERFYRLGSELRRETQGIGIGLSIVRHIVEAHGGSVLVESKVGKGSRFTIELPVKPKTPLNTAN